jgi:branched-chain amino acid transport system substrate-binding protein
MVDQSILSSKGKAKEALVGVNAAGPFADTWEDPKWQAFVKAYQDAWPPEKRFTSPSLCAVNYYDETEATLQALDKVNGDLSDGHKKFRAALATLVLDAPNGKIKLDENHQAIGTSFVTEVVKDKNGDLVSKVVQVVPNVDQRLGFSKAVFASIGLPGREVPVCKKNYD